MSRNPFKRHVEPTGEACPKCGKGTLRWYTFGQHPPKGHHVKACKDGCDPREPDGTSVDGVIWRDRQRRRG